MRSRAYMLAVVAALVLAGPALADWDPEQPAKWVQYPDLNRTGIDVDATHPYLLADDFQCTVPGPITDIHIWGSWLNDYIPWWELPEDVVFTLSIHKDIPAEQSPTGYSMPGEVLWYRVFQPGEFAARIWAAQIEEGWLYPPDDYIFPADWTCWQYNFYIDPDEAFHQEGTPDYPIVYWLDVQAQPLDADALFGWKTSVDHWNDDAVWGQGQEPYPGPWFELIYPPGHQFEGQSIDLAFVITTQEEPPDYLFEFSLDIASDIELSDPQMDGDEAADPGDVYWWQSAPIVPPGRDGFKDDFNIFGTDPWPDPPDALLATRVPVPTGTIQDYAEWFDLDGHDQTDFSLYGVEFPLEKFPSACVYGPENLMVSFDDDMERGWPANDVPVTRPSMAGAIYGTTGGQDEIVGVTPMIPAGALPPYPIQQIYPIADEVTVHSSLFPNPDNGDQDDDDVDSLDIVPDRQGCPYWFFSADHEAFWGLDPGGIYEVTAMGPVQVIDEALHLGIPEETDIDAFEFVWLESPDGTGGIYLALLYSVDQDDPLTAGDESGAMDPTVVYASFMNGMSFALLEPLFDDIDALTCWRDSLQPTEACCFQDGSCLDLIPSDCISLTGFPMGPGTTCSTLPPMIITSPADIFACENDDVYLNVVICGAQPISYQWDHDGTPVGPNSPILPLLDIRPADAGNYTVTVFNGFGTATAGPAAVGVQIKADSNCDGLLNTFDIDPFVLALTNQAAWQATYGGPTCDYFCANDINRDSFVNTFDIDPFVACLIGGGCP